MVLLQHPPIFSSTISKAEFNPTSYAHAHTTSILDSLSLTTIISQTVMLGKNDLNPAHSATQTHSLSVHRRTGRKELYVCVCV